MKSSDPALDVKKTKVNVQELNSPAFNFDEQMLYRASSKWNDFFHWWENQSAKLYKWHMAHPILIYSLRRIFYGLVTLLIAICVIALLVHIQIDPDDLFLPKDFEKLHMSRAQADAIAKARMATYGYSTNPFTFLGNYLYNLMPFIPKTQVVSEVWATGPDGVYVQSKVTKTVLVDLGVSFRSTVSQMGTPVTEIFADAIPYSAAFGMPAIVISFACGIPLGIEAAKKQGKAADRIINGFNLFISAVPALILVLGIYLLAVMGFGTSTTFASGSFWSKFWPFITLILFNMPLVVIMTRRYMVDEMNADYTKFAYSQGFSTNRVFYVYIFRNAGIKILATFPVLFLSMLVGTSLLVETQWSIPGMSSVIVTATGGNADPYIILGYVAFTAFIEVFSSLLGDLIVVWMDPRVSLGRK